MTWLRFIMSHRLHGDGDGRGTEEQPRPTAAAPARDPPPTGVEKTDSSVRSSHIWRVPSLALAVSAKRRDVGAAVEFERRRSPFQPVLVQIKQPLNAQRGPRPRPADHHGDVRHALQSILRYLTSGGPSAPLQRALGSPSHWDVFTRSCR